MESPGATLLSDTLLSETNGLLSEGLLSKTLLSLIWAKVVLGSETLRPSLVSLSLRSHAKLLESKGLLIKEIGPVGVVVLRANGSSVARLGHLAVTESLLSVFLSLGQIATSLPLSCLLLKSLSLLVSGESLVAIAGVVGGSSEREVQPLVAVLIKSLLTKSLLESLLTESLLESLLSQSLLNATRTI